MKTQNKKVVKSPSVKEKKPEKALSIPMYDTDGNLLDSIKVSGDLFNVISSDLLLSQYVRVYLANQRQGTHSTKSRGEINATTKKMYRQKGTGRARHGAKSAPIFVGGGVAHGPVVRSHALKLNKKQRRKALLLSLTLALKSGRISAIKAGTDVNKTKELSKILENVVKHMKDIPGKTMLVYSNSTNKNMFMASENISDLLASNALTLNAYEVLSTGRIIFTEDGLNEFVELRSKSSYKKAQ